MYPLFDPSSCTNTATIVTIELFSPGTTAESDGDVKKVENPF